MQTLILRPVSCSFKSKAQTPCTFPTHFTSLHSKHLNTQLHLKLRSPRIIPEENEHLVLQRNHGEVVVYELLNKRDGEICHEDVENKLRWQFIYRVYAILAAQISFCAVVSAIICLCVPVQLLLNRVHPVIVFVITLLPFILSWPLALYRKQYPLNIVLLGILTACVSIDIGICAAMNAKIVFQALLVTLAGISSLTGYTFWASREGKNYSYLRPFLSSCLAVLIATGVLQLFFPLVSQGTAGYAGIVAMFVLGCLIYDTDSLIKRYKYNEHIAAAVSIYLDIVILFLSNLDLLHCCSD